ncbi:MAG: oligosaccharide flippase family protein [Bacteroidaceae bacterium]|nr:oligosaccharide flippase family protein [Bacteroidaceae bacterium]MBP9636929.1 oligosaccharide flippase family protein [Bacteroidaceae bacterium]
MNRFSSVFQREFVRNSAKLLSGNVLGQLIAFSLLPLVARLYSKEDVGVLGLFLALCGVLSLFAGGKYEFAILIEPKRERAAAVFDLSFLLNLGVSLFLALLLLCFSKPILSFIHYEELQPYALMIPVFVFLSALGQAFCYWFNYHKQFFRTATYGVLQVGSNNLLKTAFGFLCSLSIGFTSGAAALIAANQLSYLIGLIPITFKKSGLRSLFRFNRSLMHEVACRHAKFPRYYLPHTLVNYVLASLVMLLLPAYFGMEDVGLYSMCLMLGFRPIGLLSGSLEQVLSQNIAARVSQKQSVLSSVYKLTKRTLLIALPVMLIMYFLIPWIVDFYLGTQWSKVTLYLRMSMPLFLFTLLCGPLCSLPSILGSQRMALFFECGMLVTRFLALVLGIWLHSFEICILLFSLTAAAGLAAQLYWFYFLLRGYEKRLTITA